MWRAGEEAFEGAGEEAEQGGDCGEDVVEREEGVERSEAGVGEVRSWSGQVWGEEVDAREVAAFEGGEALAGAAE